jgi:hypothetical protein
MAELLVKLVDPPVFWPKGQRDSRYYRGDVIVIMPDGHIWGREEAPPQFGVFKIPGILPQDIAQFLLTVDEEINLDGIKIDTKLKFRRKFSIMIPNDLEKEHNVVVNLGFLSNPKERKL